MLEVRKRGEWRPCRCWLAAAGLGLAFAAQAQGVLDDALRGLAESYKRSVEQFQSATQALCLAPQGGADDVVAVLRLAGPAPSGQAQVLGLMAAQQPSAARQLLAPDAALPIGRSDDPVVALRDGLRALLDGQHEAAADHLGRCQDQAAQADLPEVDAVCSGNRGVALALMGRAAPARAQFERSRQRYEAFGEWMAARLAALPGALPAAAAAAAAGSAASAPRTGRMAPLRQKQLRQQAGAMPAVVALGVTRAWLNLGNLALATGQLAQAEADFRQAAAVPVQPTVPADCGVAARQDLARLLKRLGRGDEVAAQAPLPPAGAVSRGEVAPAMMYLEPAVVTLNPDGRWRDLPAQRQTLALCDNPVWRALGQCLRDRGEPVRADRSPVLGTAGATPLAADALAALLGQARADAQAGRREAAVGGYAVVAARAAAAARPELLAQAHAALMALYATDAAPGAADSAIVHGKLAVNALQPVRASLGSGGGDRAARRAYLRERSQVYADLAQALLARARLAEAEQVLALLKADEGQQLLEADETLSAARSRSARLGLQPAEAQVLAAFERQVQALRDSAALRSASAGRASAMLGQLTAGMDRAALERERLQAVPRWLNQLARADAVAQRAATQPITSVAVDPQVVDALASSAAERLARLAEDAPQFSTVAVPPADVAAWAARAAEARQRIARDAQARRPPAAVAASGAASAPDQTLEAYRRLAAGGALTPPDDVAERAWRAGQGVLQAEQQLQRDALDLPRRLAAARLAPDFVPDVAPEAEADVAANTQRLLAAQARDTAVLYLLPGTTALDVLVVTATGRQALRLPVPATELDQLAAALLKAMDDDSTDAVGPAQAMYRRVMAPLEPVLARAGTRVLVLSLTGALRAVPFAALHDGQRWLVERFAIATHPGTRLAAALRPSSRHWRIAAFGASRGDDRLRPLPHVPQEIRDVVGSATGQPRGRAWLDDSFNRQSLRAALAERPQVLHIASHFEFRSGNAQTSQLLLGDGSRLSLAELAGSAFRLDGTELVTLSACESGRSGDDAYGQEVDGLAALLMAQGAPSVLASLWQVEDDSTARLMAALYALHDDERLALGRAQALQRAQVAMIQGEGGEPGPGGAPAAAAARGFDRQKSGTRRPQRDGPDTRHPHHWAPFVLVGAWR